MYKDIFRHDRKKIILLYIQHIIIIYLVILQAQISWVVGLRIEGGRMSRVNWYIIIVIIALK